MRRIGLLAPMRELPGEYGDVVAGARESASLWQVIVEIVDSHDPEELARSADPAVLRPAAERMARWRPDAVAWGCTSASFASGRAVAVQQRRTIEQAAGAPATSTSLAFVEALGALGADTVALLSPYPEPATAAFVDFLAEWGIAVRDLRSLGYPTGADSESLRASEIAETVAELDGDTPIVVPDTAVWGFELLADLGPRAGAPLLTANQVTLWHTFDLAGMSTDLGRFAALRGLAAAGITNTNADLEEGR
jgi:maleate cis-trans isomerase